MLECSNDKQLIDERWETASAKVLLPESLRDQFLAPRGLTPVAPDNKRSFHRYYMRGKSVLKRGETVLGGYTVDISRQGVGFLSPVPLLPKERITLQVPTAELCLEVARCRRAGDACFVCGAKFVRTAELVASNQ